MTETQRKRCRDCGETKPLSEFYKSSNPTPKGKSRGGLGVRSICKICTCRRNYPGLLERRHDISELSAAGLKRCNACKVVKPNTEYHNRRASDDGLSFTCKVCSRARTIKRRLDNPSVNIDWHRQNPTYRREYMSKWEPANRDKRRAINANRIAMKLRATPQWADRDALRALYTEAARRTDATGIRHDVDHIVPLRSRVVCGLHVPWNLRVTTREENASKGNRLIMHLLSVDLL